MTNKTNIQTMSFDEICDTWDNPESASIIEVRKALKAAIEMIKKQQKYISNLLLDDKYYHNLICDRIEKRAEEIKNL